MSSTKLSADGFYSLPQNKKPYLSNLNLDGNCTFGSFGTWRHQMEIELLKEHGLDMSHVKSIKHINSFKQIMLCYGNS